MSPVSRPVASRVLRGGEFILAWLGAIVCVGVAVVFAAQQLDDLWPAPGLYFLEIIFLALGTLLNQVVDVGALNQDHSRISWIAGGVLLPFVILGGFSIGPFLFPAMLAYWLSAALGDIRQKRPIPKHLALALVAGVFQAALIGILLLFSRLAV